MVEATKTTKISSVKSAKKAAVTITAKKVSEAAGYAFYPQIRTIDTKYHKESLFYKPSGNSYLVLIRKMDTRIIKPCK